LTDRHNATLPILLNKSANIIFINKIEISFSVVVKVTAQKPPISKFYLQIQRTDASGHIHDSPLTGMTVIASVQASNF